MRWVCLLAAATLIGCQEQAEPSRNFGSRSLAPQMNPREDLNSEKAGIPSEPTLAPTPRAKGEVISNRAEVQFSSGILAILFSLVPLDVPLTSITDPTISIHWPTVATNIRELGRPQKVKDRQQAQFTTWLNGYTLTTTACVDVCVAIIPHDTIQIDDTVGIVICSPSVSSGILLRSSTFKLKHADYNRDLCAYAVLLADVCDSDFRESRGRFDIQPVPGRVKRVRKGLQFGSHQIEVAITINGKLQETFNFPINVIR
jgi:hypothetical protein